MEPMAREIAPFNGEFIREVSAVKNRRRGNARELDQETADALVRRLCNLLDTADYFGKFSALSPQDKIVKQFLASPADQQQSDFNCAVSPKVRQQVPLVFQAVAGVMEEKSGAMVQSTAEINGEGFGRGLLYSGRVILVLRSLRAGFPFPFTSEEKVIRYGVECIEEGLAFLDKYKEVTAQHGLLSLEG
jgi:probable nitrogen fixation protein